MSDESTDDTEGEQRRKHAIVGGSAFVKQLTDQGNDDE